MKRTESNILTLLLLMATVLWTGCTDDKAPAAVETADSAIRFAAAVEQPVTRAGAAGMMDYHLLASSGFGVYAFGYTDDYASSQTPNLFCNAQVAYTGSTDPATNPENPVDLYLYPGNWSYVTESMPLKYWERDETTRKVSFFAYAPYVSAGSGETGITAVSENVADDPKVNYTIAEQPSACVDLLWGVKSTTGRPWTNATLDETDGPVLLTFYHALSAIGFHVQAMVDADNNLTDLGDEADVAGLLGTDCKVTIKSLTLTCTSATKFRKNARLNLNNATAYTPSWADFSAEVAALVLDGGAGHDDIATALKDQGDMSPSAMTNTGVMATANQQLVIPTSGGKEQFFMVIPDGDAKNYTVTLEYYVTYKTSADTYKRLDYTGVNAGTVNISDWTLEGNTKYYLNFVIGLKTLRLDVTAVDWANVEQPVAVTIERGTSASESLARRR